MIKSFMEIMDLLYEAIGMQINIVKYFIIYWGLSKIEKN
jgi:hypothetical protein